MTNATDFRTVRNRETEVAARPIFVSPETAAALLGISRSAAYDLLRAGDLESVRHGKRRLVSRASVDVWAQAQLAAAGYGTDDFESTLASDE